MPKTHFYTDENSVMKVGMFRSLTRRFDIPGNRGRMFEKCFILKENFFLSKTSLYPDDSNPMTTF